MNTRSYNRLIRGLCVAGVLLLALTRLGSADERSAREYEVKAAFLFHFAEYCEWPADAFPRADSPLVIGLVGRNDPFPASAWDKLRDKRVRGHPIVIAHYDTAANIGACQVLFVCDDQADALDQVLQKAGNTTLTVGDLEGFTDKGGLVRFFPEDNHLRFEINLDGLRHSRLKMSSQLLKLAKIVHE